MSDAMTEEYRRQKNVVYKPPHYRKHPSGVECIEISQHFSFNLGNALKYIWRADHKHGDGGLEDLRKAEFYIKQEIHKRQGGQGAHNRDGA